jgi:AcrR family transcriptional regulator
MESPTLIKNEPRFERRKGARPSELTAAALELFVEKGFAATRLEDVATRAGVSKGTLYLYFDSKEDLFKAVIRGGIVPAIMEAEQLIDKFEGSAADLVRDIVSGWYKLIGSTRLGGIPKLMIAEARNFPEIAQFYHDEVVARGLKMMSRALKRGIDRGEFRPVDVEHTVQVMIAPLIHFALWRHSFAPCAPRNLDPDRYLASYLFIVLEGLRTR